MFIGGDVLSTTRFRDLSLLTHASPSLRKARIGPFMQWDIGLVGRWTPLFLSLHELSTLEIRVVMPGSGGWIQVVDLLRAAPRSLQNIEIRTFMSAVPIRPLPASILPDDTLRQELRRYQRLFFVKFIWVGNPFRGEPRVEEVIAHFNKLLQDIEDGVVQHDFCSEWRDSFPQSNSRIGLRFPTIISDFS